MTIDRTPPLTPRERERYARHLVLPDLGESGQRRLKGSSVLVVGLGGLGSPVSLYLAAAGVGRLGLVDDDVVTFSNLQRQVLHGESGLGKPKVESAKTRIQDLNSDICVEAYAERFDTDQGARLARGYDLIVDGTDSLAARYVISDVCLRLHIPYVYGAIFRLEGQVSVLCTDRGPCYRCLFPEPPPAETLLSGEQAGILGAVPGTIGTLQATEAIKWLAGLGEPLVGRLLVYDAYALRFELVETKRDPTCPACGSSGG
jgi:molybdopterin/thiamine biosynthesis adenylyltransferase